MGLEKPALGSALVTIVLSHDEAHCAPPRNGHAIPGGPCQDRSNMTDILFPPERPGDIDNLELEERHALRRVAGLSTELADVTEVEYRQLRLERVVLVGVWTEGSVADAENSLTELAALAETAGSLVLEGLIQRRGRPDAHTFIARGKVAELRAILIDTLSHTGI